MGYIEKLNFNGTEYNLGKELNFYSESNNGWSLGNDKCKLENIKEGNQEGFKITNGDTTLQIINGIVTISASELNIDSDYATINNHEIATIDRLIDTEPINPINQYITNLTETYVNTYITQYCYSKEQINDWFGVNSGDGIIDVDLVIKEQSFANGGTIQFKLITTTSIGVGVKKFFINGDSHEIDETVALWTAQSGKTASEKRYNLRLFVDSNFTIPDIDIRFIQVGNTVNDVDFSFENMVISNMISIPNNAFKVSRSDGNHQYVIRPNSIVLTPVIKSIGESSFNGQNKLERVRMSVNSIEKYAFANTALLNTIYWTPENATCNQYAFGYQTSGQYQIAGTSETTPSKELIISSNCTINNLSPEKSLTTQNTALYRLNTVGNWTINITNTNS